VSGRYFIATNIVTIPVIVYFLSNTLDRAEGSSGKKWRILVGLLVTMEIISNVNSLYAETWWNKELSQVRPQFIDEINKEQTILIVSGLYPTNFGDVLLLSLEVNPYVHFRLYEDPEAIEIPNQNKQVYWFPSSYEDVQEISEKKGLQVREVLPGTLWKIE
jgi:hypothetical protein